MIFQVPIRLHDKIKETRDPVVGLDHVKVYQSYSSDTKKFLKPLEFIQVLFPDILKTTHKYVVHLFSE